MRHFAFTCQGESHKATNKPCQDFSYSSIENGVAMAIVSDGHGGERYFRSDVGSRLCVQITADAIKQFVSNVDNSLFKGKPLTRRKVIAEMDIEKLTNTDNAMRQLFSSIIATWNQKIDIYTQTNPLTEEEKDNIQPKFIEAFLRGENLEKTYGCTLMAYVQTPLYWFAFQIGDGKCVSFHNSDVLWQEPIEWDDRCFLNKTTSICDSDALNEFRYTYCGDRTFPVAIFLGSDGIDDSFGPMENLVEFYMQITKLLATKNDTETKKSIMETLPVLSKRGSQDDMSLVYIYNETHFFPIIERILKVQIKRLKQSITTIEDKITYEIQKYNTLLSTASRKDLIDRNYSQKNIDKLYDLLVNERNKLIKRRIEHKNLLKNKKFHYQYFKLKHRCKTLPNKRLIKKLLRKSNKTYKLRKNL